MEPVIFHIDVNSAFLSWTAIEQLKNGSTVDLRTIPSIIGGDRESRHGIVLAKSTSAKTFGIKTGEPVAHALRKCESLVIARPDHAMYRQYSKQLMTLLRTFTPDIEQLSIDECFLDFTPIAYQYKSPIAGATLISKTVKEQLGFTVNIGIAPNKLLAKMASDFEKPNRVHTLFDNEIEEKMFPLPIEDLFMVGKSSSKKLHELNINTVEDLAKADINMLTRYFKSMGRMMHEYANGIDDSPVERPLPKNKGIGNSTTLPKDATDIMTLKKVVKKLSFMVGIRLREEEKYATVIAVQLKNNNFMNFVHKKKLVNPVSSDDDIYENACVLLKEMWNGDPIRLVGLRVSDFTDKSYEQVSLFERVGKSNERDKVQRAMDKINKKYGNNTIKSAALFEEDD